MKNKLTGELAVCGINAVKAIEKTDPEKISRLYLSAERAPLFGSLCRRLAANRIPYNSVAEDALEKLCGSVHHQGVVAMIRQPHIPLVDADYIAEWAAAKERVLVLDNVGNANNFGAIVRSAAFFGWKHVVIEADKPYITTSAYRVAEGGMEYVEITAARSIPAMLKSAAGKILRAGSSETGRTPAASLAGLARDSAVFLILGNEERGLSLAVEKNCDIIVKIAAGRQTRIESLNVAQAAAILLYEGGRIQRG